MEEVDDGTFESWTGMHQKESSCLVSHAGNPQKFIERDGTMFVDPIFNNELEDFLIRSYFQS